MTCPATLGSTLGAIMPDCYDELEVIAWDLYSNLVRQFCWHCGHEESRDQRTYEVLEAFRMWVASREQ